MEKERNTPSIRFKGFTGPWEQRKLNDLCELITKQTGFDYSATIKPSLVREKKTGVYPFIQNKDFSGNNINLDTDFYIPIEVAEKFPRILLDKTSLLISISGRIGNVGLYNLPQKSFIGGAVGICKLKDPNTGEFLVQELESEYGQRYFQSLIKASSHANITVEDIRNIALYMPSTRNERQKISDFLLNLDSLITLHQRKLDREKKLKEYLLQNMFPSKGKNVPKVRFWKFTDKWRPQKIGDLCLVVDTKHATAPITNQKTSFRMIRTDCIRAGQLLVENTDSVAQEIYEKWSERIHLQRGDLVFTREAPIGECAVIPGDGNNYFPGQRIVTLRSKGKVSTLFLNYLIYADEFRQEIRTRNFAATTVANFGIPAIKEYITQFPSIDEQNKIGQFFSNLDSLITRHQRKLEGLKELKKGFLQKMFV